MAKTFRKKQSDVQRQSESPTHRKRRESTRQLADFTGKLPDEWDADEWESDEEDFEPIRTKANRQTP